MNRDTTRVLFAELAAATEDVRGVSGRLAKVERLAAALRALAPGGARRGRELPRRLAAPARARRRLGLAARRPSRRPPTTPTLTVAEVDTALAARGGDERRGLAWRRAARR